MHVESLSINSAKVGNLFQSVWYKILGRFEVLYQLANLCAFLIASTKIQNKICGLWYVFKGHFGISYQLGRHIKKQTAMWMTHHCLLIKEAYYFRKDIAFLLTLSPIFLYLAKALLFGACPVIEPMMLGSCTFSYRMLVKVRRAIWLEATV